MASITSAGANAHTPQKPDPEPSSDANHAVATATPKFKRLRFTATYDLHLVKRVRSVSAYLARWGKMEALYEDVTAMFLEAVPDSVLPHSQRPNSKTLTDRPKRLLGKRREVFKLTSVT